MATMSSFSYQYPMERVLYSLHHQICTAALRHTSFRARNRLEKTVLLVAVCAFGALWLAHVSLVHRGSSRSSIPITCLPSIEGFRVEADVAHLLLAPDGTGSAAWMLDKDDFVAEACQAPTGRILFSYSNIKGYLLLSKEIRQQRGLQVQYIAVAGDDVRCFGEPFLQTLVAHVGADTVMLNWLSAVYRTGFVYNPRTEEMMELVADSGEDDYRQQVLAKLAVVLKTSFLFFITTTLVSFTLRETQSRMLDFTHQLQAHVRAQRSVVQLVTQHLMENLVFVPIMVGMIFFLIEFYRGDKFLAFMVVTLVWLCEVFSVIRCVWHAPWAFFVHGRSHLPSLPQSAIITRHSLLSTHLLSAIFALSLLSLLLSLWLFLHGLGLDCVLHDTLDALLLASLRIARLCTWSRQC